MREKICLTSNARAFMAAASAVTARDPGLPGILLCSGESGRGKTSICARMAVKTGAIFLTALPIWSPRWMLSKIAEEMGGKATGFLGPMYEFIARELTERPRPIYVDESDSIAEKKELIETLRILHDMTAIPLVLIGMGDFRAKVERRPQLCRRILRAVDFKPSSPDDSRLLATELAEVRLADELIDALHRRSHGSAGLFVKELAAVEAFCRRHGLNKIALGEYPIDDSTPPPVNNRRTDLSAAA
jgi:DNA transposition AAA+ family ATPase